MPAPDTQQQSGRLSGFGYAKQTAQGVQAALANRVNAQSWDQTEAYNTVTFETINGQLDSIVETRQGVTEITGRMEAPAYSAQGIPFLKGAVGTAINGAADFTFTPTVAAPGVAVGDVGFIFSGALPTLATAGYTGAPDFIGATLTIDDGLANAEDVVFLGNPSGLFINTSKFTKAHTAGATVKIKRASTFIPNTGANAAALDFFSVYMQFGKLFESQYTDWQVNAARLTGDAERLSWQYEYIGSAVAATELAFLSTPSAPTVTNAATGGTVAAGVYGVKVSYVNALGETIPSAVGTTTTSGSTSTITIAPPQPVGGSTGWYAYVSQAGGSVYKRQQTPGSPTAFGTSLVLTAAPSAGGVDAATLTSNTATLSSLVYGTSENGDSPMIQRDGGIFTRFNATDTNMYVHNRLTALNWGLEYGVQKDKVGGGENLAMLQTLSKRTQNLTWTTLAGQQGPLNMIRQDYARTNKEMPIVIWFKNAKSGNCFSIVMRRCTIPQCDPIGPTDNPVAYNFSGMPLIDTTTGMAVSVWVRNGVFGTY
jgi:hypothetical protein